VLSGESFESFLERWNGFLRGDDVLAGWGFFWSEALRREGAKVPEHIDLRLLARKALRTRPGDVEACAAQFATPTERPFADGRTGRRLAAALDVAKALVRIAAQGGK